MDASTGGHVLITVTADGSVDYCSIGEVRIVLIDYRDAYISPFPDEVDAMASTVKACPTTLPWRDETIIALKGIARAKRIALMARLPMLEEDPEHAHHLPDAG
jgi:hypothetical protein